MIGEDGKLIDWGRDEVYAWLKDVCKSPHEFDFWYIFYDDLEDCFEGLDPWVFFPGHIENERREMRGLPRRTFFI